MKLTCYPYTLELKDTFTISHSSRKTTDIVLVELEQDGITGYGESSLPPYYPDTQASVMRFFDGVHLQQCNIIDPSIFIESINTLSQGDFAAKAAFDIALYDWYGKKIGLPLYDVWNLDINRIVPTSYTLGIDTPDMMRKKASDAKDFNVLKVKVGSPDDRAMISAIRDVTDVPLRVDVNQGWTDKFYALDMIGWLYEQGVELVEQPLPVAMLDETAWLTERSPVKIIADESIQSVRDIEKIAGFFHGVNIKLMKCGGLCEAWKMIRKAQSLHLQLMIGCMTESSCAISAAAQLSPVADWVDLDGALLVANDPFVGASLVDKKIVPKPKPGIGCKKRMDSDF